MAALNGDGGVREMTSRMASRHRHRMSGREATIAQETESVRLFDRIAQKRYAGAFAIRAGAPEDLLNASMPRLPP